MPTLPLPSGQPSLLPSDMPTRPTALGKTIPTKLMILSSVTRPNKPKLTWRKRLNHWLTKK